MLDDVEREQGCGSLSSTERYAEAGGVDRVGDLRGVFEMEEAEGLTSGRWSVGRLRGRRRLRIVSQERAEVLNVWTNLVPRRRRSVQPCRAVGV